MVSYVLPCPVQPHPSLQSLLDLENAAAHQSLSPLPNTQVVDTAADLSGGTVVTTAAATQASSSGNQPLLDAIAPSAADMQSGTSSMVRLMCKLWSCGSTHQPAIGL